MNEQKPSQSELPPEQPSTTQPAATIHHSDRDYFEHVGGNVYTGAVTINQGGSTSPSGSRPPAESVSEVQTIERLLAQDRLEEAIELLLRLPEYRREAVLFSRRLAQVERQRRQQQITDEDVTIALNRLAADILSLIDRAAIC